MEQMEQTYNLGMQIILLIKIMAGAKQTDLHMATNILDLVLVSSTIENFIFNDGTTLIPISKVRH